MTTAHFLETALLVLDYGIKIVAVGVVPENRRPSSSSAWLLLILLLPIVGLPLFLMLGSARVNGRRHRIQAQANERLDDGLAHLPTVPPAPALPPAVAGLAELNRELTSLPCVTGVVEDIHTDYLASIADMVSAVEGATSYVHAEIYIMSWDEVTDPFFTALAQAAARGVEVRLLMDHLGSRRYTGFRAMQRRLDATGIQWRLMLPIKPLRRRWRRLDLRNHRKLVVVDGLCAYVGSQNMIEPHYASRKNARIGRAWHETMVRLRGQIVSSVEAVFAVDWYTESGELLQAERYLRPAEEFAETEGAEALQLVPSGPGFTTQPNLRLFTSLMYLAQRRLAIVSPYFVPDESILEAVTTAAYRGVRVDLYVNERADQFMVHHAQASYYRALLEAGVHIHRYPAPAVLHSKFFVVDDEVAVIGSSNMDMRSFGLNYEISLMGAGGDLARRLRAVADGYEAVSSELTAQEWDRRPWRLRYLDNALRLTSALQ